MGLLACSGTGVRTTVPDHYRNRLDAALAQAESANGAIDDAALSAAIADPLFDRLPSHERHAALIAAGNAAISRQAFAQARDSYQRAVGIDPGRPHDWYVLSLLEHDLADHAASRRHFMELLRLWPEGVNTLDSQHIAWLVSTGDREPRERRYLLEALFQARWDRGQSGTSAFWFELALHQIDDGDLPSASKTIERIDEPMPLIMMLIDRRFDPLVDPNSPRFDVARSMAQQLRDLKLRVSLEPYRLSAIVDLANAMLIAGQHEVAAATTGEVIGRIEAAPAGKSLYTDMEDEPWVRNIHAIALRRLGRTDDALAALTAASRLREGGGTNISQSLNLGQLLCSLWRPADALAAVSGIDETISPYGLMVRASVQLRAAIQQGDHAQSDAALQHLRENRAVSPLHFVDSLLRLQRFDEAADALMALLASTTMRDDALIWSQSFLAPDPLPGDVELATARAALVRRQDVADAIDRVGRIGSWPVFNDLGTE